MDEYFKIFISIDKKECFPFKSPGIIIYKYPTVVILEFF